MNNAWQLEDGVETHAGMLYILAMAVSQWCESLEEAP